MGFKFPWDADALAAAYDGPITLTPDGGPFLYNDAVPYEMLLAAGVIICFYPATMTFLLVLSSLWMVPLTKGLIKALKKATKKD